MKTPLFWLNIVLELVENRVPDSGDRTLEINQSKNRENKDGVCVWGGRTVKQNNQNYIY